ncbi:MAG: DUF484 family protein [Cocleimonas sp.]
MSSQGKTNTASKINSDANTTDSIMADAMMDESVIADYLQSHPDFFQRHSELLATLQVPHQAGTASLIERQVAVLRDKSRDLEEQLNGLIRTARGNEQIVTRLQRFTLELMRADNLNDVIATCQDILRDDFNADFVTLRIIGGDDTMHFVAPDNKTLKHFDKLFATKKPVCGRLKSEQQDFLFKKNADAVNSVALIPLAGAERIGVLALGSEDETRFHPGMGTVFISHLGELISASLSHHLK